VEEVVVHELGGLASLPSSRRPRGWQPRVVGDGLVEADGVLDQRPAHPLDPLDADAGGLASSASVGLAAVLGLELAAGLLDLVVGVDHVDRQAHGAALSAIARLIA
jgi:hypothetical protein